MSALPIDLSSLKALMETIGGDADDLQEFVADFTEISRDLVQNMQSALGSGDINTLRISAHTLKSNARDMGASALGALCAEIEQACKEDSSDLQKGKIDQIGMLREEAVAALSAVRFEDVC